LWKETQISSSFGFFETEQTMATDVEPAANTADKFSANAEELEGYYLMLEAGNIPELQWQFPGRRAPSPEAGSGGNSKELEQATDAIEQE